MWGILCLELTDMATMNITPGVILFPLALVNMALLAIILFRAITIKRRPLVDRLVTEGAITQVFKGGSGVRVAYEVEGKPYSVLQINKGVNKAPTPVSVGAPVVVHVNPYRHSNATLTPRPVRDESGLMALVFVQLALAPLTALLAVILLNG